MASHIFAESRLSTKSFKGFRTVDITTDNLREFIRKQQEAHLEAGSTRNGDARDIPLIGELLEMLKIERQKNLTCDYVFTRDGERIESFYKTWASACVRARNCPACCSTICGGQALGILFAREFPSG